MSKQYPKKSKKYFIIPSFTEVVHRYWVYARSLYGIYKKECHACWVNANQGIVDQKLIRKDTLQSSEYHPDEEKSAEFRSVGVVFRR